MALHSWEVVRVRSNSCLIAMVVPPGGISWEWARSFQQMQMPEPYDVMRLAGLPWDVSRTQAGIQCLNGGYQWLFFLDCDVRCPPETIPRLMSHNIPIVSGLYRQRFPTWNGVTQEYLPCMFREVKDAAGNLVKQAITEYTPGSLVEADLVPGGCLLIHRTVFERMNQAGIKRFFNWTMQVDSEPPGAGVSEDFWFCQQARRLGYKIFCATAVECVHETAAQVTAKGFVPKI